AARRMAAGEFMVRPPPKRVSPRLGAAGTARLMPVTPPSVAFPVRLAPSVGPAGDLDSFYRFPRGGAAAEGSTSARASRPATPLGPVAEVDRWAVEPFGSVQSRAC